MRAFSCVAEAGSFTAAAAQLDTTTANISRAVSNLEAHLQTRLLNRTTRRIALTEAGKRYLLRCEQILAYVEEAEAEASDAHARPAGQLKVHTMTGIGQHFVIDAIARYRKTHPDVTFDLTLANRVPDILDEGYDVSIVLASELPDSGFVSQRLGITYSIVCASPAYVKASGCPQKNPATCSTTPACAWSARSFRWKKMGVRRPGRPGDGHHQQLTVPGEFGRCDEKPRSPAAWAWGVLPVYAAIEGLRNGTLVRVMPNYRSQELNLYAIYPSRQYLDAKIKTWVEYLRGSLPEILAAHQSELAAYELSGSLAGARVAN
nr:LysR family transcriptional regulator [Pseudomonas brassicacearum subsp. brassicacearum]